MFNKNHIFILRKYSFKYIIINSNSNANIMLQKSNLVLIK